MYDLCLTLQRHCFVEYRMIEGTLYSYFTILLHLNLSVYAFMENLLAVN